MHYAVFTSCYSYFMHQMIMVPRLHNLYDTNSISYHVLHYKCFNAYLFNTQVHYIKLIKALAGDVFPEISLVRISRDALIII